MSPSPQEPAEPAQMRAARAAVPGPSPIERHGRGAMAKGILAAHCGRPGIAGEERRATKDAGGARAAPPVQARTALAGMAAEPVPQTGPITPGAPTQACLRGRRHRPAGGTAHLPRLHLVLRGRPDGRRLGAGPAGLTVAGPRANPREKQA